MNPSDTTAGDLPFRDVSAARGTSKHISEAKERQLVAALSRQDLEDKYLRLREDHIELKKLSRSQEEKMKQMATKLLRLFKDKKKIEGQEGVARRDTETSEFIEDLQAQIRDLNKANEALRNKLTVTKQHLLTQGKKQTPYDNVKPRVETGISSGRQPNRQQRIKDQMRVQGQPDQKSSARSPQPLLPQPRYGHSLLEETRIEKRELEDLVASLQEQIRLLENEREVLKEQGRIKDLDREEDRARFETQISDLKKANMKENVELIRLEREIKEKSTKLEVMQGKFHNLEQMLEKVKMSNEKALGEMESLTMKLKEEQARNSTLNNQLRQGDFLRKSVTEGKPNGFEQVFLNLKFKPLTALRKNIQHPVVHELDLVQVYLHTISAKKDETIADLRAENDVLKEAQDKLLQSTFDAERERRFRLKEREYQVKISQLEAVTKADVLEKNELLDKLSTEREDNEKIQTELRELRVSYYSQKELYEDLAEKMKFFSRESNLDIEEMQEAIILIKSRKEKQSQELSFLEKVDEESSKDLRKQFLELQTAHADTINELEKTRSMLKMQNKINKDYQLEVDTATRKMDDLKKDCDMRIKEYAEMLDIRAERIKKLEAQLKDIAYGTKQYKIQPAEMHELESTPEESALDTTYELERGQNVMEIHIGKVLITKEGLKVFGSAEPMTFVTLEFFEFEMQATPVVNGQRPVFAFTSQYVVNVDDFFLHYIQKEQVPIEFHQAVGTEYKTIATGKLRMNDLLEKSHGRIHGALKLMGLDDKVEFGVLEYWMRLRVPMEQALRLYKERSKALGYMTSNALSGVNEEKSSQVNSGINELKITIDRCHKLKSTSKKQPSAYAVYKFFDFADHDTEIITHSSSPEFNDVQVFPVPMSEELDSYLKTTAIDIYVFDDNEAEPTAYIGIAKIPLVTLSQDKPIKGTFQLLQQTGETRGTIDVTLQWLSTYLPASAKVRTYPTVSTPQDSLHSVKQPIRSIRESMRPLSTDELQQAETRGLQNETTVSMASEKKQTIPKRPSEEDQFSASLSKSRPRSVSFNEDTIVKSYDENQATLEMPKAAETGSMKLKKEEKAIEEMSVDDLIRHAAETEDDPEDSGNNYESDEAMMEEELRRTVEARDIPGSPVHDNTIGDDTLFEEPISDDVSADEDDSDVVVVAGTSSKTRNEAVDDAIEDDVFSNAESNATSDSEGVVVSSGGARALSANSSRKMVVTIEIASLMLYENASLYNGDTQVQLYVAYRFLDEEPASLETPDSLPLPKPNRPIYYNFKKVFHVDNENHEYQNQLLMSMLMPDHPSDGKLFFSIVTEPVDGDTCEDAGVAYVDFVQMLKEGRDFVDEDIEIVDFQGELIGTLTVTVEALDALRSLYE